MKKYLLTLSIFLIGISESFAGVETDNYCENGVFGKSTYSEEGFFNVNYGSQQKVIKEVLRISYGQTFGSEGVGMLFYSLEGDAGFEVYSYNCSTKKPKLLFSLPKKDFEMFWIATYNEPYIVFGKSSPGLGARDSMESIYIYDIKNQRLVVKLPSVSRKIGDYTYGYQWAEYVYKTKKGIFLLFLGGYPSSVIEINPRTGKITEL